MSELEASEEHPIPALSYYRKQRKWMLNWEVAARFQAGVREVLESKDLRKEMSKLWGKQYVILSLVKDFTHYNYSDHLQ